MDKEVVFVPINGQPVPLSIHTIKNVTQPDPDNHCYYLRINFFTSGTVSPPRENWEGIPKKSSSPLTCSCILILFGVLGEFAFLLALVERLWIYSSRTRSILIGTYL